MEAYDVDLLIEKTDEFLNNGMIDNGDLTPARATMEIQKLKGDDGKIYRFSIMVELEDLAEAEHNWKPYLGND